MIENKVIIKVKKLNDSATIPTYAHNGDVGMDFTAISVEYNKDLDVYIYHTGLAFESDLNYGQFIFPRSSNRKTDAYLTNSVGIIDTPIYRGEIMFCFKNRDSYDTKAKTFAMETAMLKSETFDDFKKNYTEAFHDFKKNQEERALDFAPYKIGDKIGQMVIFPYPTVELEEVSELSETERGTNGFGSTDKTK